MPIILCIETSTTICSVALFDDMKLLSHQYSTEQNAHAQNITILISKALKEMQLNMDNIDVVSVSKGPGSYTGLRIGVSTAKGICYALNKPLIAVDALIGLAYGIESHITKLEKPASIIPMIDARRMEVYCSVYDHHLKEKEAIKAKVLDEKTFEQYFKEQKCFIGGTGAEKFKELHAENENIINTETQSLSVNMIQPTLEKYKQSSFEDVAYFEPFYLKDFIAGKPKKML